MSIKRNKKNNLGLKAIDFFCSAGGVTCGFEQAGIDVIGGVDIDENCKETYERNNDSKFLCNDVADLTCQNLIEEFGIKQNQDDLIFVGCSPCQYYSNIKTDKQKSQKTRLLLEDFQSFVQYFMPGYIFVENVPGFDKNPDSPIGRFKKFLKGNKYSFKEGVLNAKYLGVPQNRRRYVLLASRVDEEIRLPKEDRKNIKTVREVIGDTHYFKPIKAGEKDLTEFLHSAAALNKTNIARIKETPKDGGDRRSWPKSLQPRCYKSHTGHYDVYGRMYWDKPAPAITTRFNSYSNGRYGHPEQNRAISLREGATLQSFPLDYKFCSESQGTVAKMIGNAVPPEMARRIGLALLGKEI